MKNNNKDEFLTVGQVAKLLKCCNKTIYNLVANKRVPGKIYAKKVGTSWKILREDVYRFFKEEDNQNK